VPQSTEREVNETIERAQEAFKEWRRTSVIFRQQRMFELQRLVKEHMVVIRTIENTFRMKLLM
jgi:malonate-semialdehyde dehydrogenase (acetylating) / methylmalonate-semialdehyde dehydrogenase